MTAFVVKTTLSKAGANSNTVSVHCLISIKINWMNGIIWIASLSFRFPFSFLVLDLSNEAVYSLICRHRWDEKIPQSWYRSLDDVHCLLVLACLAWIKFRRSICRGSRQSLSVSSVACAGPLLDLCRQEICKTWCGIVCWRAFINSHNLVYRW